MSSSISTNSRVSSSSLSELILRSGVVWVPVSTRVGGCEFPGFVFSCFDILCRFKSSLLLKRWSQISQTKNCFVWFTHLCLDRLEQCANVLSHSVQIGIFVSFRKCLPGHVWVGRATVARVALSIDDVIDVFVYCYVTILSMCSFAYVCQVRAWPELVLSPSRLQYSNVE